MKVFRVRMKTVTIICQFNFKLFLYSPFFPYVSIKLVDIALVLLSFMLITRFFELTQSTTTV